MLSPSTNGKIFRKFAAVVFCCVVRMAKFFEKRRLLYVVTQHERKIFSKICRCCFLLRGPNGKILRKKTTVVCCHPARAEDFFENLPLLFFVAWSEWQNSSKKDDCCMLSPGTNGRFFRKFAAVVFCCLVRMAKFFEKRRLLYVVTRHGRKNFSKICRCCFLLPGPEGFFLRKILGG